MKKKVEKVSFLLYTIIELRRDENFRRNIL